MPKPTESPPVTDKTSDALARLAVIVGTFFGVGYFPFARGTLASAITVVLAVLLWPATVSPLWLLVAGGLLLLPGVWAGGVCEREFGRPDPGRVVLDEVVGQMIALAALPRGQLVLAGWKYCLLGFILFRLLDIFKPFPIGRAERLPHGWGIMADDCLAGGFAFLGVRLTAWWGG